MRNDIAGQAFGRLTVLRFSHVLRGKSRWLCRCTCGNLTTVVSAKLKNGHTKSCGCYRVELSRAKATTHGLYGTPEYRVWDAMIQRCGNPNDKHFKDYGGRGIFVCASWRESFEQFLSDMGQRPSSEHSIDRKMNNLGYSKENCRWATRVEQANNKSNNRLHTIGGKTQTVAQWARDLGVGYKTFHASLGARGDGHR